MGRLSKLCYVTLKPAVVHGRSVLELDVGLGSSS